MAENNTITFSKEKDKLGGFSEETLNKISQPIKDNSGKFNNVLNQSNISNKPQDKKTQKTNNKQNNVVNETPDLPSDINEVTAKIANDREKALKIKNEVINKGGDKEVLKSELVKAFPDKDDLATVASYFKAPDENSDTEFSLSDDEIREMIDSVGKTAIEEKTKELLQGVGGGEEVKPTEPTTTPTTKTEPTEEKPKKNFFETDPSLLKRANSIRSKWEKEMKTPHQFYSRIFSVPEWFPKGLDEFREAKKKYTNRPVYNKDTGKYEMGEGASPIAAKKELDMAKQVVYGIERDIKKQDKGIEKVKKGQDKANSEELKKIESELRDMNVPNYIKDNNGNFYYIGGGKDTDERNYVGRTFELSEDGKQLISGDKVFDIGETAKLITPYETKKDGKYVKAYDDLAKSVFDADEKREELLERKDLLNSYINGISQELADREKETLDAIKNGDLADANKKVEELKSAYDQSWKQQNTDMQEYSAAKRKLIKENAGNIARNVWFIIDLVTTMNRNAARLMPQGKYSPNLGNFETPALFQDYAAQLQNMRDAYNKVNTERSMADIEADKKELGNIFDVDKDMMSLIPQEYRNELQLKLNKGNAEIEKDLARLRAALNVDVTDEIANRALFRFYLTEPDIVANMNTKQIKDFWTVARMKAEGYDDIALNSFKEQLNEQLQKGNTREAAAMIERLAKNTLDYKVATPEQLKTLRTIQNIRSGVGVVGDAVGTIKDAVSIFSPIPITAAGATQ